jgi:hypothetical protein
LSVILILLLVPGLALLILLAGLALILILPRVALIIVIIIRIIVALVAAPPRTATATTATIASAPLRSISCQAELSFPPLWLRSISTHAFPVTTCPVPLI